MLYRYVLPCLIWLVYRLWSLSWRTASIEHPSVTQARRDGRPCVYAHWHGDELAILRLVGPYRIATMTSTSRDGQVMDRVLRLLGGTSCRGSSSRGGMGALKGLVRLCRNGHNASLAVDGPRGPLHEVKPGVFQLARLAGGVVVPVGVAAGAAHIFHKSWNKAQLPWPFARVVTVFGPAMEPAERCAENGYDEATRELADAIHAAGADARRSLADRSVPAGDG